MSVMLAKIWARLCDKKLPTLKPWVWGVGLFLSPSVIVLCVHVFRPLKVVHVDMGRLMKVHAVHGAQGGVEDPLIHAQAFKDRIQEIGRKKAWIMTEQAWGDPKVIQTMKDVTDEVARLMKDSLKVPR